MPRVNLVQHARKSPGKCSKCGTVIKEGEPYKHWSFRYGGKRIRCVKPECTPRASDLTQSKLGAVYEANEAAEQDLANWEADDTDILEAIRDSLAEAVRSVAEEYREAASNFGDGGPNSEAADNVESYAEEVEGVQFEEFDVDAVAAEVQEDPKVVDEETANAKLAEMREDWREEQRDLLREVINGCSL